MSTSAAFAVTFVIYQTVYIVLSIITITCGFLTRFYLSIIHDNHIIHAKTFESFSFTTLCLIYLGVIMIIVSLMSCSILINEKTRTALTYLLVMSIVIAAELYVGCHTYGVPNDIKKINEKNLNEIFGNVTSEDSFKIRTNNDAISIQQSLQCCGFNSSTYWKDNNKSFMQKYCCQQPNQSNKTGSSEDICDSNNIWQDNCLVKSADIARQTTNLLCVIIFISMGFKTLRHVSTYIVVLLRPCMTGFYYACLTVAVLMALRGNRTWVTGILCFLHKYEWHKY